jgi:hypothetical protein
VELIVARLVSEELLTVASLYGSIRSRNLEA